MHTKKELIFICNKYGLYKYDPFIFYSDICY